MIFTTAGRPTEAIILEATRLSGQYNGTYIPRKKRSLKELIDTYRSPVIVAGFDRLFLYTDNALEPVFFHPNSAMFRCKSLLNNRHDVFINASGLTEGMSLLDCTAGLGSDSIVASLIAGEKGSVQALEGSKHAILLQEGLKKWQSGNEQIDEAMRRVSVKHNRYEEVLPYLADQSVDVVYFDPMFEDSILESNGVNAIKQVALYDTLTDEMIREARRVARKRVVLKDYWKSSRFERFGFQQFTRKTAKFHYGILENKE
ncbi:class I SAM-dependent methyltransferase [Alkalihalobacillus macyae]|uniref:class I SAM-dependent methyltransferase n=1 Tax=Guptibacillus hwajinpoensis TaxID=208199 RepID=UPI00273C7B6A|nr:class I SAM-dependent methyltransferase [Alkalihalobacillus macyae]MDP4550034.1 class I SAM-dependent methyltransferase [Alkalihalobacillus macyae]